MAEKTEMMTIELEKYEALLIELGELRKLNQFMAEFKSELLAKERELKQKDRELEEIREILLETEWKDYELEQTQKRIRELELEVERLKLRRSLWKRFFP